MIRISAAARLHFGLLSLPGEGESVWPDRHGEPALPVRRFGGVGLMIESPTLRLHVEPAKEWSAEGPLAERALSFAHQFANQILPSPLEGEGPGVRGEENPSPQPLSPQGRGVLCPQRLVIESAPSEHCGFGTGTQLGLAVAKSLAVAAGLPGLSAIELARRVGRGLRSALGVHGFAQGGFLVEAGKRTDEVVSPLVARVAFPDDWRIIVVVPPIEAGFSGEIERATFRELLIRPALAGTDALCRLVLLGMLPALIERDLDTFGEALHDFNARAGEVFVPVQGGTYAGRRVSEVVMFLRRQGVRGVGQSSWGPAVFAIVGDADQAAHLARTLQHDGTRVYLTVACNHGAEVVSPIKSSARLRTTD